MNKLKQHLVLVSGSAVIKGKSFFSFGKKVTGFVVIKSYNYPAQDFYTKEDLDELTDMGITYEVKK
jgi:hypothetical protein